MKEELGPSACLEHDLLLLAQFELQVLKNEVKHGKNAAGSKAAGNSRMTGGSGAAQEFDAVQEWAGSCHLCRCKVRCLQMKNLSKKGPMVGLVDWCCGKEQCGDRLIWYHGFGRSENGSEMLHRTCCIC